MWEGGKGGRSVGGRPALVPPRMFGPSPPYTLFHPLTQVQPRAVVMFLAEAEAPPATGVAAVTGLKYWVLPRGGGEREGRGKGGEAGGDEGGREGRRNPPSMALATMLRSRSSFAKMWGCTCIHTSTHPHYHTSPPHLRSL